MTDNRGRPRRKLVQTMAQIFAFREDRLGFHYQLGAKTVLGTAPDCDLILLDRNAHPHQAEIFLIDEYYYIADLSGAPTTRVNGQPVTLQTRLESYDTIEVAQELFVFEPGLTVLVGPAPPAFIIHDLAESFAGLLNAPAEEAAGRAGAEDWPELMTLAHHLAREAEPAETRARILEFLQTRFGMTFAAVLWPSRPLARRLVSMMTSSPDRRLMLSRTSFLRATRDREVLVWPQAVAELSFQDGRRQVSLAGRPVMLGPMTEIGGDTGLLYLEGGDRPYTDRDLRAFAAFLAIAAPAFSWLAETRGRQRERQFQLSEASEVILSGNASQVKAVFTTAAQAAEGSAPIFLTGEAGTGKSALAEYIHKNGAHRHGRLVTANLAALAPADLERALFGRASVGPADLERPGLVELADGGTLFLRHVEYLTPAAQKSLLRVVEEGVFFPLAALQPKAVNLRLVSATSVDLEALVEIGRFRRDLFLRLSRVNISMPPLREIKNDLENLAANFLQQAAREIGIIFTGLDPAALECLRNYSWPGNIAELKRVAGLLVLFGRQGRVARADLPAYLRLAPEVYLTDDDEHTPPLTREAERYQLIAALARQNGDLEGTATVLNLTPEATLLKIRALGLDPVDYQPLPLPLPAPAPGPAGIL